MSQAFVKEGDGQWLHDVQPTLSALISYLTRENNNIRVYVKKQYFHQELGKEVYEMNDGFTYAINSEGQWYTLDD